MRWDYNDEYRDEFTKGPHRDILIVPHATNVIKVPGSDPIITSKVPEFNSDGTPKTDGHGNYVYTDVDWTITNKDIIKEKFKYTFSLNPSDNISFTSASSAMVQFTIRNNKEYNPDTDTWELDIPNLQYYYKYDNDGNLLLGELNGNYIIKVYTYINGDSSTLLCLGMFRVEEDKAVDNGYNREITAYDFMATFRDMDIFNWYKHLFTGINKLDNDYLDYTNKTGKEEKKPDKYDSKENWIRKKKSKWTVKEALQDLIDHLASFDMIVWDSDVQKALVGATTTNPSVYARDYGDGCGYSGLGMPVMLDTDIMTKGTKPYIPSEPGEDEYERYGYMDILELEFMEDPKIIKSGSLSMGKFLEDIGLLAGRYPFIRPDRFEDGNYIDPSTIVPTEKEPHPNKYNNYERCILSFKPLPTSKDDAYSSGQTKLQPEQQLTNNDIAKGFEHSLFTVKDVLVIKIGMDDGNNVEYKRLTKQQRKDADDHALQEFSFNNNMFCSYLVEESDNEDIAKNIEEYKKIKTKLFGKEKKNHNMTNDALFYQGYNNIKNRSYVPYKLTTYGDPVRDVGDRLLIDFEDKVTGEKSQFYTFILERTLEGVQKMMDTYEAKGALTNPTFSNYQAGTTYQSGFDINVLMLGYRNSISNKLSDGSEDITVTPESLVSYLRNIGIRLLDEPIEASAIFVEGSNVDISLNSNLYITSSYPQESYIRHNDTTNPITVNGQEITVKEGDYIKVKNYQNDDPAVPSTYDSSSVLYVYTANDKWELAQNSSYVTYLNVCGAYYEPTGEGHIDDDNLMIFLDHDDYYPIVDDGQGIDNVEFTTNNLFIRPRRTDEETYEGSGEYGVGYYWKQKCSKDSTNNKYYYGGGDDTDSYLVYNPPAEKVYDGGVYTPEYGDTATIFINTYGYGYNKYIWEYPGFWVKDYNYPTLNVDIHNETKDHVELQWEDPDDITSWKPTPADWQGTVVVRKENSAPKHMWDGIEIVRTTLNNKNAYKDVAYNDEDIEYGKTYYYGFFPYYKNREEDGHDINFFRYTKVIKVEINSISSNVWDGTDDIDFFTNDFNSSLLVDNWDMTKYKVDAIYANEHGYNPSYLYSDYFLTEWNLLIGNQWLYSTIKENGELKRAGRGANRSDSVFWIPIKRIKKNIVKITADYAVTNQYHWGGGYDRVGFWIAYVGSNNDWNMVSLGNRRPSDENWHTAEEFINNNEVPYVDYIGIEGGDGIYHVKNIVLTVK